MYIIDLSDKVQFLSNSTFLINSHSELTVIYPWCSQPISASTSNCFPLPSLSSNDFHACYAAHLILLSELLYLDLLILHLQEFHFKLLDDWQVIWLLLSWCLKHFLKLSNLFLFSRKLSLSNLEIDLQDTLFASYVLVHLMDLVQILLEILSFLLKLQVIAWNWVL